MATATRRPEVPAARADAHPALASQPMQMLLRITRQSRLGDPEACAAILALLATGKLLRANFHALLAKLGLTEAKFTTLITLYALDPEPSTPADLAAQVRVSRAAMTEALEGLHARGLVRRERGERDRRTFAILLTDAGRTLTEKSVRPFLGAISRCADSLSATERAAMAGACDHLFIHFREQPA